MTRRSDTEVIAEFMEPRPRTRDLQVISDWWEVRTLMTGTGTGGHFGTYGVVEKEFTPSAIRRVEDQLSPFQLAQYANQFPADRVACLRATTEQKIAALAIVLRPLVEHREAKKGKA